MDHDLHLQGHGYALRPVRRDDAAAIVALRTDGGPYINRGAASEDEQRAWIERYLTRDGDYYFAAERIGDAKVEALAAIYDVDPVTRGAEWGRFVVRRGANAAIETALLVYRAAFDVLALEWLVCRTLAANVQVVAFHDSCGLARMPGEVTVMLDGVPAAGVEHRIDRASWPSVSATLDPVARRLAARMHKGAP
ncbi:MAG: GNAT family N-acetyltransferase [Burkholderiales bacterium]